MSVIFIPGSVFLLNIFIYFYHGLMLIAFLLCIMKN